MEIIKKYKNDDLTIFWKPKKCIHAGICVQTLPAVYKPKEKPWINQNMALAVELKEQIDMCPSGALSYELNYN